MDIHLAMNNNIISIVDNIEDYIKSLSADYKIDLVDGEQLLKYTLQIKDIIHGTRK